MESGKILMAYFFAKFSGMNLKDLPQNSIYLHQVSINLMQCITFGLIVDSSLGIKVSNMKEIISSKIEQV